MYTYAQIPLKMSGQHASGELFVYTNKKALAQGEKDLTAFLHLDLVHLVHKFHIAVDLSCHL